MGKRLLRNAQKWMSQGQDRHGTPYFLADVKDDMFVHFTLKDRAQEIINSGKILLDPPHPGFGIYAVCAVSASYGRFVPGVQTTHYKVPGSELVAVLFSTNTVPKIGYPEEVIWDQDVDLASADVVSYDDAVGLLSGSRNLPEDFIVVYDEGQMPPGEDEATRAWVAKNCLCSFS